MGGLLMSNRGRLVLVALCLTWTDATRALAQVPNPPVSPAARTLP
jgi:hypothetical protein